MQTGCEPQAPELDGCPHSQHHPREGGPGLVLKPPTKGLLPSETPAMSSSGAHSDSRSVALSDPPPRQQQSRTNNDAVSTNAHTAALLTPGDAYRDDHA